MFFKYSMKYLGGKNKIGKHIASTILNYIQNNPNMLSINPKKTKGLLVPFCGSLGVLKYLSQYVHDFFFKCMICL